MHITASQKCYFVQLTTERLEVLREKQRWTWQQLAEKLDLSVSMLMMVKRGHRELGKRAQWRLDDAEVAAGLRTNPSLVFRAAEALVEKIGFASEEEGGAKYSETILALEKPKLEAIAELNDVRRELETLAERVNRSIELLKGYTPAPSPQPDLRAETKTDTERAAHKPYSLVTIPKQVVSTEESLQGVSAGARERVRAAVPGAMKKAKAMARESEAKRKAASTSGNKDGPSGESPKGSPQ